MLRIEGQRDNIKPSFQEATKKRRRSKSSMRVKQMTEDINEYWSSVETQTQLPST